MREIKIGRAVGTKPSCNTQVGREIDANLIMPTDWAENWRKTRVGREVGAKPSCNAQVGREVGSFDTQVGCEIAAKRKLDANRAFNTQAGCEIATKHNAKLAQNVL